MFYHPCFGIVSDVNVKYAFYGSPSARKYVEYNSSLRLLPFVPQEDESLSKDDLIPSSLLENLFLPAFPFFLSIMLLKQFSAVNISVLFSEPIAHVHSSL